MKISVVIPTYNRINSLKRVLNGLANQSFENADLEVIVVSDGSTDGTNNYLLSIDTPFAHKSIIQKNAGVAAARNTGINAASGDLILFIDDDVVPTPQLLTEHVKSHIAHGDKVVVLGPMLTPPDFEMVPWVRWEQAMLVKQYKAMQNGYWQPTARQFYTGNSSLARRHLQAIGGFDTRFSRAEDVELAYRLADNGLTFIFNGQAIGYHYAERSFPSWLKIPYAYGVNDVIFAQEKGQEWILPVIQREFYERNILIRAMTKVCLDRPIISKISTLALRKIAFIGQKVLISRATNMAYSGIFNLRYYQGVADQLGGRVDFFVGQRQFHTSTMLDQFEISKTTLPEA